MHSSVYEFGRRVIPLYELGSWGQVIELGSMNINGSLREFFDEDIVSYTGFDVEPGPGVDVVINGIGDLYREFEYQSSYDGEWGLTQVDTIICTEMLEHDKYFWETLLFVNTVLQKGGWFVLSARGVDTTNNVAMFEHSYPGDYWRFMPQSVPLLMEMAGCEIIENHQDEQHPGFYALGRKL